MGFTQVEMIGKGAYGFVFVGTNANGKERVFKFSRITLPQNVRERLEEEGYMLNLIKHPNIPAFVAYENIKKQGILVMERGQGMDLHELSKLRGSLPVATIVKIAGQLAEILAFLRSIKVVGANGQLEHKPIIHGDIKPSNLVWDEQTETLSLIDWGSCVFAQLDESAQPIANNVMELMSADMQNTNAKLGDVYFIGNEQLNGELSSPRFDEQGAAATLYALASNQNCRYGYSAIPPASLGLPKPLSIALEALLTGDKKQRELAGDRFVEHAKDMQHWYLPDLPLTNTDSCLPVWIRESEQSIETVVYSSRKSFLRQQDGGDLLLNVKDAQLDKYYKNYLQGMGDNEKAFIAAVSRFSEFPIVGGLAIHWQQDGIYVDSNLNLFDGEYKRSVSETINNMVDLARSLDIREGTFKSCLFDAKNTIHVERGSEAEPFELAQEVSIPFEVTHIPEVEEGKQHSYFEDGEDPDERLALPVSIMEHIVALNNIHHTGCIIFEVLPKHLKIHNYYHLLDKDKRQQFQHHLDSMLKHISEIKGIGVSGYMKLPYTDAKQFEYQKQRASLFYPANPKQYLAE